MKSSLEIPNTLETTPLRAGNGALLKNWANRNSGLYKINFLSSKAETRTSTLNLLPSKQIDIIHKLILGYSVDKASNAKSISLSLYRSNWAPL